MRWNRVGVTLWAAGWSLACSSMQGQQQVVPVDPAGGGPTMGGSATAAEAIAHPNIVFMLSDDQRSDSIACMDKLHSLIGAKGVTFENFYGATPLCCPARTTEMTGRYPHNHGVRSNGDLEEGDAERLPGAVAFQHNHLEDEVLAKWLHDGGYRTALMGKYLNGYSTILGQQDKHYVPPHWDDWYVFNGADYYDFQLVEKAKDKPTERVCYLSDVGRNIEEMKAGKMKAGKAKMKAKIAAEAANPCEGSDRTVDDGNENYSTDLLADKAVAFLRDAGKSKQPFFLEVAVKAPHAPFSSPHRYEGLPMDFTQAALDRVSSCPLWDWKDRPASVLEQDVSDKPEWVRNLQGRATMEQVDRIRKRQIVSVLANEDALEKIVAALKETGHDQDTVIIYMGDNGYAWGEHGWTQKNCVYEECANIPLIVYDPRHPQNGRVASDIVQDIDFAPTVAELAGVAVPAHPALDGHSIVPLIMGQPEPPHDALLTECWGGGISRRQGMGGPGVAAAVRSGNWKYVENYPDETVDMRSAKATEIELYDLEKDPFELDNLAVIHNKPGYKQADIDQQITALQIRLHELQASGERSPYLDDATGSLEVPGAAPGEAPPSPGAQ